MRPFLALIRKQIVESLWTLVLSGAALFGLGWLFVYVTAPTEAEIISRLESGSGGGDGRLQFMRTMGVQETSVSSMMTFWNHPLIILLLSVWAIGRGSVAAAEIERGTMDLLLSRPVARSTKLYNPIELVDAGDTLGFNLTALSAIGAICIALAFLAFAVRDLPTNG